MNASSLYERAVAWLDEKPTEKDEKIMDRSQEDDRIGDPYAEGLVVGFVCGYRAALKDRENGGSHANP